MFNLTISFPYIFVPIIILSILGFITKNFKRYIIYNLESIYYKTRNEIKENGKGYLYQKFLETKERLESIGLFSPDHKKRIPMYSENIGIITSQTGDALNDIVSTINKRFPLVSIYLYPALVQGPDAPKSLIKALNKASLEKKVDVVIIARGGGSFEV